MPVSFEEFWSLYPKRTGSNPKAPAREVWNRINPSPALSVNILANLQAQAATWHDPDFIPHARTWLRQRRWEDTVEAPPRGPAPTKGGLTKRTQDVLAGFGGDREFTS